MARLLVAPLVSPTAGELVAVGEVFDQYRRHYGELVLPGKTLNWLKECTGDGRLNVFTAHLGEELVGLATAVVIPASLRLSHYWQLRDLYVVADVRHRGTGRALLEAVCEAATASGALRLSVQTEVDNRSALRLYRACGFHAVEGYEALMLPIRDGG